MNREIVVRFMVLNDTFNNISVITLRSASLVEETGVPGEKNHPPVTRHWQCYITHLLKSNIKCILFQSEYTLTCKHIWLRFQLLQITCIIEKTKVRIYREPLRSLASLHCWITTPTKHLNIWFWYIKATWYNVMNIQQKERKLS